MANPAVQKLKHGKALCKATFGRFVETFNFLVDWTASLKGDKDANPAGDGHLTVDRADPTAPVIRCSGCGGGGGAGVEDTTNGCWSIVEANDSYVWANTYVMLGANLVQVNVGSAPAAFAGKFVAVRFGDLSPELCGYDTIAQLIEATNDVALVTVPIGKVNADGSGYDIDFRLIPHVSVWDTYTAIEEEEEEVST